MKVVANTENLVVVDLEIGNRETMTQEDYEKYDNRNAYMPSLPTGIVRICKDGIELTVEKEGGPDGLKKVVEKFHFADLILMNETLHKILGPQWNHTSKSISTP